MRADGTPHEVVVVGAGVAGLVAALRLAKGGRRVRVLAKGVGATHLTGATVDVLGYSPERVGSPAAALPGFVAAHPDHPYARIGIGVVDEALSWLKGHLADPRYVGDTGRNFRLPTAVGVPKPSAVVPQTMAAGDVVDGKSFAIVGLPALKDFYADLVAGNLALAGDGIEARAVPVGLDLDGRVDVTPPAYARRFADPDFRAEPAPETEGQLGADEVVGVPAVLGLAGAEAVWEELEGRLERPVFEIPTLPPSVPGLRLFDALMGALRRAGGRVVMGAPVVGAEREGNLVRGLYTEAANGRRYYPASHVVLASGGWAAGGIEMDGSWAVRETVLDLPVCGVPAGARFLPGYLDHQPLAGAGVAVDRSLRPVDGEGDVVLANVRVAGATLAGAEPWKEKSGDGISVSTGYHAAVSILAEEG